ncbi:MAG: nucleotidyltransferase domain-containing protein [Candidatus Bathycorpusculaceae bacterium]
MSSNPKSLRRKVAKEAANLIYFGVEKEYKQAKLKAAETFGTHFLPTNLEVAIELDKIAEENEGSARMEHLVKMRREALKAMKILKAYNPLLVGSVWRGTIHRESDVDIILYHDELVEILKVLEKNNFNLLRTEWVTIAKKGQKKLSFHIYLESPEKIKFEIVVRSPEEVDKREKCDIYGDKITGLEIQELERLLEENPLKRFVPFKDA